MKVDDTARGPAGPGTWLRGDLVAGLTITAYLVPQVMAYATLAGLPPEAGLWAAVGALAGYAVIGTSPKLSVGPESTTALMTAAAIGAVPAARADPVAFATLLALMVAAICVVGWLAHLDALASLLSRPVLIGYMAGIAVIMILTQGSRLTGVPAPSGVLEGFGHVVTHLGEADPETTVLGAVTLVAMVVGSIFFPRAPMALAGVALAAAAAALLDLEERGVALVGSLPRSLPDLGFPDLPLDSVPGLLLPAIGIAFVGYTDNVLTARSFAQRDGQRVDARRELLGLGAANLGAGLLQGFPVSSSGSRTVLGDAVGSRTKLTGVVTLAMTLLAVFTLGPLLAAIPTAALGAVIVYAALRLIDFADLRRLAAFRRSELALAVATTAAVVFLGIQVGVVVAIGLSVLDLLRRVARPHDAIEGFVPGLAGMHDVDDFPDAQEVPGLLVYRYDSPLFFANAEDFRTRAIAAVDRAAVPVRWFVLNAEAIVEVDITGIDSLESVYDELDRRGIVVALARVKQDLRDDLGPTGLLDRIGPDHDFPTLPTAVAAYREFAAAAEPPPA